MLPSAAMRRLLHVLAGLALGPALLAAAPARAQTEGELPAAFSSDRPGFANTTAVAARGRLITELGVSVAIDDPVQVSLPSLSMRTGVFDWLELRVWAPNGVGVFGQPDPTFGIADPVVGFKIGGVLTDTVAVSSVWEVSLPLGTDGFGQSEATVRGDVQLDWRFFGPLVLTPNAVASIQVEPDAVTGETVRFFEGGGSLKLTWEILDVLAVFVQSFVLASDRYDVRVAVGGGVYGRVAPNAQVDASFDAGVTDGALPPTVRAGTTILW